MKTIKQAIVPVAFFALLLILVFKIAFKSVKNDINPPKPVETEYTLETFQTGENGWGYKIRKDNKLIIKQDLIPAIENRVAFKSEADAHKTGNLVIEKFKKNQLPTLSRSDLEQLKIKM